MANQVIEAIDVEVPVSTAYNQWTQFESFPHFMHGVERVEQKTDTLTHWQIEIGGVRREFDAEITEQIPDERIAWTAVGGTKHAGVVTFHHIAPGKCRVTLQIDTEPEGFVENVGDKLGLTTHNAKRDLAKFKEFIESRQVETGAWRGEVPRSSI